MNDSIEIIDLFSGCGGFSLGAHFAGLDVALAIDVDPTLSSSFSKNFPQVRHSIRDLALTDPSELVKGRSGRRIAGVVGGPPCQAFSEIGRRHKTDIRRDLVWHFFKMISVVKPAFFVMENVRGLGFTANRFVLDEGLNLVASKYEIIGPIMLDAALFGAPTRRKRMFVVGVDREEWDPPRLKDLTDQEVRQQVTVSDAISDLQMAGHVHIDDHVDWWAYNTAEDSISDYARWARARPPDGLGSAAMKGMFSAHLRTRHTAAVQARFSTVLPGAQDAIGKHLRLEWTGLCPTLRAGTGSDRGSYQSVRPIHPDEDRVITVREGARLQGFPDWFVFHPTIWHSFRMIGNSVSPIMSKAILDWIGGSRLSAARSERTLEAAE